MPTLGAYAAAFGATVILEVPLLVVLARWLLPEAPWRGVLVTGLLMNAVSHPLAFWVLYPLLHAVLGSTPALAIVEGVVVLAESVIIARRHGNLASAAVLAGAVNLFSFCVGAWAGS